MPIVLIPFSVAGSRFGMNVAHDAATFQLDTATFPDIQGSTITSTPSSSTSHLNIQTWAEVVKHGVLPGSKKSRSLWDARNHELCLQNTVPRYIKGEPWIPESDAVADVYEAPAIKPKFHRFLELPTELRLEIWKLTLDVDTNVMEVRKAVRRGNNPARPGFLPQFCYTSRRTFDETVATVIGNSQMMICSYADNQFARAFLAAEPSRFDLVRHLDFRFFSRFKEEFGVNADLELAFECKGLRTIKLNFHCSDLIRLEIEDGYDYYEDDFTRYPAEGEELFNKYKLARILDCDALNAVIIEHSGCYCRMAVEAAEGLGRIIEQKFAGKVPKQIVKLAYTRQPTRLRENNTFGWSV
ncbi:hypothetical protein J4E90_004824 [Alternaria incomplexa]|uniref:uncharacterized protein n=1 Tax=Alternaria incomplexa TaxID=1187928 RepID=UPI00221F2F75|nr:uncharacterized protein J4E90_004824 [Alternaria incomplexa]KAI4914791.1 hypothetical protein J4E90_004824 [Alternaria incomplexa]